MSHEDIQALAIYATIGAVIGAVVAIASRRSRTPYSATALWSTIAGTLGGPMVMGFFEAVHGMTGGLPFEIALNSFLGMSFLLLFSSPIYVGLPAAVVGCAFQRLLQRR